MKKIISMAISVILALGIGAYADTDIYDEVESMIEAQAKASQQTDKKPARYLKHWPMFLEKIECESINIYNDTLNVHIGEGAVQLEAEAMPINSDEKELSFKSSDPQVLSIDENGMMESKSSAPGSVTVTVSCGDVSKDVEISLIKGVEGISLSRSDMLFYIDQPVTAKLEAVISPSDATNKNVIWSSENTAVASVSEDGTVTPVGTGSTNIVARTEDGGFEAKCIVYVQIYNIPVRAVFITNAVEAMRIGSQYALTSYLYPQNARDKTIEWHSSNPEVVTVDGNGNLNAVSEGMSVITVRATNGADDTFTISCVPDDGTPFEYKYISLPVEERIAQLSMPVFYKHYGISLSAAIDKQMGAGPTVFTTNASSASRSDVEKYINPHNFTSGYAKYQFLDLTVSNNMSAGSLNNYLQGKGVLEGKGEVFIEAARANGISEAYLAVHSVLESGNGTSELASGVVYNGVTVYNLFGIGAYDNNPVDGGAEYAFEHGWTSIDAAIYGGAQWISENYINNGQNTLYKMKWNPDNPATHQYATDVAWAIKQARTLKSLVETSQQEVQAFEVPVYSGQDEPAISWD